ncbi:MAG: hypothetical protein N3G80_01915 [Candidatus Micrarchaeota archaeon]|nr:hypothetical protein [Candidatus Micrarchaeota archaeon]
MSNERIKTQLDDLIEILKNASRPMSVRELSEACGLNEKDTLKWVSILENEGSVELQNKISGVYVRWIAFTDVKSQHPHEISETAIRVAQEIEQKAKEEMKRMIPKQEDAGQASELAEAYIEDEERKIEDQLKKVESMLEMLRKQKESSGSQEMQSQQQTSAPSTPQQPQESENTQSLEVAGKNAESENVGELPAEHAKETRVQHNYSTLAAPSIKPIFKQKKKKIEKPKPVPVRSVSIQFSERLARQVQKIIKQNQQIEKLRQEKERLLVEYYLPLQRKFESEIETISERVLRLEKNILGMQQKAADLPNQISSIEKLQFASIKAYNQAQRAYDEAVAQMEDVLSALSTEREKIASLIDESRSDVAMHKAKMLELEQTIKDIGALEEDVSNKVIQARAALAEEAERIASAEKYISELKSLKEEIIQTVADMKREMGTTKAALTTLEKQIEQLKQVELYLVSLRKDYDQKMDEISAYIRQGNQDFETLREAVEANFVRRYLKELRELTESYAYEFNQAKRLESDIDKQIDAEKKKLEQLIEEGKKIAHLYELQSKEVQGAEAFEQHGKRLQDIEQLVQKRSELESIIAQIMEKRGPHITVASQPIVLKRKKKQRTGNKKHSKGGKKAKK